jgi:hypothetical protein
MSKGHRDWSAERLHRLVELWPDLSKTIPVIFRGAHRQAGSDR